MADLPKVLDFGDPQVLKLIHHSTDDREHLGDELSQVSDCAQQHHHGFRWNVRWPDPKWLTRFRLYFNVLQISACAMEDVNGSIVASSNA